MALEKYLIAPFDENSGLTTNMKPWQIPDAAWSRMDNMYVYRGRIRKRFGSRYTSRNQGSVLANQLASRLRVSLVGGGAGIGITTAGGNATGNVLTISGNPTLSVQAGALFSIGSQLYTVISDTAGVQAMKATSGSGTFNVTNGDFTITGSSATLTTIYFYPSLPVMGFAQYEFTEINNYTSFAFDTDNAYIFSGGSWGLSPGSPDFHGSDSDFFWSTNAVYPNSAATALTRSLFTTNFYVANPNGLGTATDDPIYYWNNSTWTAYIPYLDPAGAAVGVGPYVKTSRMIVNFKGRLVLLNTIENDGAVSDGFTNTNTNYVNRARYTTIGNIFGVNAWYPVGASDASGNIGVTAGYEDASTLEAIVSCKFIKDRLIVSFEESTWELAYTGNEQRPFQWQKLNTELGSMATFSSIGFDKAIITIGETGVHSCNGSNVVRIDQKIPSEIFEAANPSNETKRICGIRDYYNEMVYWSSPVGEQRSAQPYPSRVLVYNYQNQTWAVNDDCITAFGYFDGQSDLTWASLVGTTWEQWNSPWNSGIQQQQVRRIIAGNQQGFTFIIDADLPTNASVLQVDNMVSHPAGITMTIHEHMLQGGEYIYVTGTQGATLNGNHIYEVRYVDPDTIVAFYVAELNLNATITGTYTGGATAARVSNYDLYSKQWNPYDKDGQNVFVSKIDFAVKKTDYGQVTVDYAPSSTDMSVIDEAAGTNCLMGTGALDTSPYALYPIEQQQARLWHPVYFQVDGECIQINIYMSPLQISTPNIAFEDFEIEGLILNVSRSGRLE